jgi:hypothetical protein
MLSKYSLINFRKQSYLLALYYRWLVELLMAG